MPEFAGLADELTSQLVDTRNYLTHWSNRSPHVVEGPELLLATNRLVAVLEINTMLDLSLPDKTISKGIQSRWVFQPDVLGR